MNVRKATLLSAAAAMTLIAGSANAATLAVRVSQDTYVRNDTGGGNSKWDGDTDNEMLLGTNNDPQVSLHSLLAFNVSDITTAVATTGGGDYSNLSITSATVTLFERRATFGTPFNINVSSYDSDFVEADATWNDPDGDGTIGTGDTTAGGTTGFTLASDIDLGWTGAADDQSSVIALDFTNLVSAIGGAATLGELNFILTPNIIDARTGTNLYSITSDRSGTTSRHALLDITYTVSAVPEPSTAILAGLGLAGLCLRRRRNSK